MTRTPEEIGEAVRTLRKERGLSQERLGAQAGVSKAAIGLLEKGRFVNQPYTLPKIAEALGVTLSSLVGENHPENLGRRRTDRRRRTGDSDRPDAATTARRLFDLGLPPHEEIDYLLSLPEQFAHEVHTELRKLRAS